METHFGNHIFSDGSVEKSHADPSGIGKKRGVCQPAGCKNSHHIFLRGRVSSSVRCCTRSFPWSIGTSDWAQRRIRCSKAGTTPEGSSPGSRGQASATAQAVQEESEGPTGCSGRCSCGRAQGTRRESRSWCSSLRSCSSSNEGSHSAQETARVRGQACSTCKTARKGSSCRTRGTCRIGPGSSTQIWLRG